MVLRSNLSDRRTIQKKGMWQQQVEARVIALSETSHGAWDTKGLGNIRTEAESPAIFLR
jgi:hypothetical protein